MSSRRFQPAVISARRDVNPNGVARASGRPLQGRNYFLPALPVGFTYGYSRFPASREGNRRFDGRLILAPMGDGGEGGLADPRLAPWATICRPLCGLNS